MRALLLLVGVLLALALVMLVLAPAGFVLERLAAGSDGRLQFADVSGTLWGGHAGRVLMDGADIGSLDWTLAPAGLLMGWIDADVVFVAPTWHGRGRVERRGERTRLRMVQARLPADLLSQWLAPQRLVADGWLELEIDDAEFDGALPRHARGELRWAQASVRGHASAALGELAARFDTTADGRLVGELSDRGGPLGLEGGFDVSWLGYRVEAMLTPRSPDVAAALDGFGMPAGGGARRLAFEGRWLAPQLLGVR